MEQPCVVHLQFPYYGGAVRPNGTDVTIFDIDRGRLRWLTDLA